MIVSLALLVMGMVYGQELDPAAPPPITAAQTD